MKKVLILLALALFCAVGFAQTVTLTFTGRDADNHFLPLSRVVIGNQTRGWQETIYYPDTVLAMGPTGIEENAANKTFGLAQNNPNPFNGTTDVNLNLMDAGAVVMDITDVNGRLVASQRFSELQPGCCQFRINLADAGVYFLTARQNGKTSSVKMVNNGKGTGNGIEYVGTVETWPAASLPTKNGEKGHTDNPFSVGDEMVYIGYAIVNGTEYTSQTIHQNQLASETFVLNFNVTYVEPTGLATVTTSNVTDITDVSATCGGDVTADGGVTVTARGVCWSTSHNPVFNDSHVSGGDGLGSFSCQLTGLTHSTTYYARAYAVNTSGTAYGNEVTFTTATYPTVTTSAVSDIEWRSATCGGNVTSDGGTAVTARGVCWSTSQNPTISDVHTTDGSGNGSFTSVISSLSETTTYYVRAFATNSVGTSYGEQVSFTTTANPDGQPCPGTPTLSDVDGNTYNTVQIGSQCWMKENLRTTKYADGTIIWQGSSIDTTYWYYPNGNSSNQTTCGLLYNWKAVMRNSGTSSATPSGVQGICPDGWHVPSDNEWKQMEMAAGMSQSDADDFDYRGNIAAKLSGNTGWNSSTTANAAGNLNSPDRNSTGFSALPAGYYNGGLFSGYSNFGFDALFWSTTEYSSSNAYIRNLSCDNAGVGRFNDYKLHGYSVRCVRD